VLVDWPIRYRVALGVARGLAYLHHGCDPRIVHGDVSATNILLDTDFEPYLSDFGLAKLVSANETHVTVTVGGTFGYVAPEFAKSGKATEKVDVYSYGVILLELLSGRRAVDECMPDEYTNLAAWVRDLHSHGRALEVVDQRLRDTVAGVELDLLLEVACHCVSLNPQDRPQMNKVVETLEILTSERTSHDASDGSITVRSD
jgi:serine/threonine protein kinase